MGHATRHTQGPWVATFNKRERTCQIDTANGQGTVVQPGAVSWVPDVHLIAAAPVLLEVLRAFVAGATHHGSEFFHSEVTNDVMSEARRLVRELEG